MKRNSEIRAGYGQLYDGSPRFLFIIALILGFVALIGFGLRAASDHLHDQSEYRKPLKTAGNYIIGVPVVITIFIVAIVARKATRFQPAIDFQSGLAKQDAKPQLQYPPRRGELTPFLWKELDANKKAAMEEIRQRGMR